MPDEAYVAFDGVDEVELTSGDMVEIRKAEAQTRIIKLNQDSFLETLRRKMKGNSRDMKVNRHAKIIELIGKYHIETQEELADYLNREGFKVTQATVSRDIRDLKLTKIPAENGKQKYACIRKVAMA